MFFGIGSNRIVGGDFLLLVYKEPPFTRSLILNLEPYPDTLFYSVPAWNLVQGQGFRMEAYGQEIRSIVPPLYSWYLVPFFLVFNDVRSFYLANVLLAVGTLVLFMLTVGQILRKNKGWEIKAGVLGFLLATNFYFYTLPTLLMAENISLFLTMVGFYFLIKKISLKNSLAVSLVGTGLLLTKLSNLPLAVTFVFLGLALGQI